MLSQFVVKSRFQDRMNPAQMNPVVELKQSAHNPIKMLLNVVGTPPLFLNKNKKLVYFQRCEQIFLGLKKIYIKK